MASIPETEPTGSCNACGASIYPEHINRQLAGMWAGQFLCPACLNEKRNPAPAGSDFAGLPLEAPAGEAASYGTGAPVADSPAFSAAGAAPDGQASRPRRLNTTGGGATHMRIFHSRLSEGAVRHLDEQVNAWLAANPDVEIKFANSTVGVWEGKHAEPNLILTLFY